MLLQIQQFLNFIVVSIKKLLALSAGVKFEILELKDANGEYVYSRGRYKYYGIGALVCFFSIFSAVGMTHLLDTMPNMVGTVVVAGMIWGTFQWVLERLVISSISSRASTRQKRIGLAWRSGLATLSAASLVYPFYVQSNRAAIDVIAENTARQKLVQNIASSQNAVNFANLNAAAKGLAENVTLISSELRSDPPEVPELRKQLALCWTEFRTTEATVNPKIARMIAERKIEKEANNQQQVIALSEKISALALTMRNKRAACNAMDKNILEKVVHWKNEKPAEKKALSASLTTANERLNDAVDQSNKMAEKQSIKIKQASSGFSADFEAVWIAIKEDSSMRFQAIWWFLWFLIIELVAILAKFSSETDLDVRLMADEDYVKSFINTNLNIDLAKLESHALFAQMNEYAKQQFLREDQGKQFLEVEKMNARLALFQAELSEPRETMEAALKQLVELHSIKTTTAPVSSVSEIEQIFTNTIAKVETMTNQRMRTI